MSLLYHSIAFYLTYFIEILLRDKGEHSLMPVLLIILVPNHSFSWIGTTYCIALPQNFYVPALMCYFHLLLILLGDLT